MILIIHPFEDFISILNINNLIFEGDKSEIISNLNVSPRVQHKYSRKNNFKCSINLQCWELNEFHLVNFIFHIMAVECKHVIMHEI